MLRIFHIAGSQYFGFWWIGVVLFLIQETPYFIMPFIPLSSNPRMSMQENFPILDIWEKLIGSCCVAALILVNHRDAKLFSVATVKEKAFFGMAICSLLLNFGGWCTYYCGIQHVWVMMLFLVAMPPLYYTAIGFWRRNYILAAFGLAFLCVHFIHVLMNLS